MNDTEASQATPDGGEARTQASAPPDRTDPAPHPELQKAIDAANAKNSALAEQLTRDFLATHPTDVVALKLLGDLLMQKDTFAGAQAAETLFVKCLELSPGFVAARHSYAKLLLTMAKLGPARTQIEMLLRSGPQSVSFKGLMAYTLGQIGDYDGALKYHEAVLADIPRDPSAWMGYANDLRAAGRTDDCVAAYRRVLELNPELRRRTGPLRPEDFPSVARGRVPHPGAAQANRIARRKPRLFELYAREIARRRRQVRGGLRALSNRKCVAALRPALRCENRRRESSRR